MIKVKFGAIEIEFDRVEEAVGFVSLFTLVLPRMMEKSEDIAKQLDEQLKRMLEEKRLSR